MKYNLVIIVSPLFKMKISIFIYRPDFTIDSIDI